MFSFKSSRGTPPAKPRKSALREWFDSVAFAVVAATLLRFLVVEAYAIPTPSMENSLLVGDFLFVSKLHYGIRTPQTPLQIPLTHQTIWGTKIPSYLDWIQLPMHRLPGFSAVRRGDVVVFNFPPPKPNEPDHPTDQRTHLIKRCVGLPGDVLAIRQEQVFANGRALPLPRRAQSTYFLKTTEVLTEAFFRRYGIVNDYRSAEGPFINWQPVEDYDARTHAPSLVGYQINTTVESMEKLRQLDWIKGIEPLTEPLNQRDPAIYGAAVHRWNRDQFGPLTVPKKGMTIALDRQTIAEYGPVIARYEGHEKVELTPTTVRIGGQVRTSYTFRQDYYFMMGDSRHNSDDSRYWGFVPEDHLVGKAVFVWMSLDPVPDHWWNTIRWDRLFRVID